MATLTLSPQARDDLQEIGDWIARDNPSRAVTFVAELQQACRQVLTFPHAYPPFPQLGPAARRCNHGRYAINFDVDGEAVKILTVVHGARDLSRLR